MDVSPSLYFLFLSQRMTFCCFLWWSFFFSFIHCFFAIKKKSFCWLSDILLKVVFFPSSLLELFLNSHIEVISKLTIQSDEYTMSQKWLLLDKLHFRSLCCCSWFLFSLLSRWVYTIKNLKYWKLFDKENKFTDRLWPMDIWVV